MKTQNNHTNIHSRNLADFTNTCIMAEVTDHGNYLSKQCPFGELRFWIKSGRISTIAKKPKNHFENSYNIYQKEGLTGVCNYANKHKIPYKYCSGCNTDTPNFNNTCLACGL